MDDDEYFDVDDLIGDYIAQNAATDDDDDDDDNDDNDCGYHGGEGEHDGMEPDDYIEEDKDVPYHAHANEDGAPDGYGHEDDGGVAPQEVANDGTDAHHLRP
jgi:hypothetical protein